mgnify:CR=1 FL=1
MATIELEKLVKRYGKAEAVRGIDLSIADGEFVVLVGPSGCGKSTTLRMIAGLEEITPHPHVFALYRKNGGRGLDFKTAPLPEYVLQCRDRKAQGACR